MSLRLSAWTNSAPTTQIFIKFDVWEFLKNMLSKFKFHYNLTRITGTLREDQCIFMISRWILLRRRNISNKSYRECQNTIHVQYFFLRKSSHYHLTIWRLTATLVVVPHRWPTYAAFFLFIQQIYVLNILNMLHTLRFFLFKMSFIS